MWSCVEIEKEVKSDEGVKTVENVSEVKVTHSNVCEYPDCSNPKFSNKHCSVHTDPNTKESTNIEKKVVLSGLEVEKMPQAEIDDGLPDNSNLEDDDVDITELTKKIEKSLSNLDQAEVE